MSRHLLAVTFFIFCIQPVLSQEIIIDSFAQSNDNVMLKMRIKQANDLRERYTITLSSSFNGGNFQLLNISRDDVAPGEPVVFTLSPSDLKGTGTQLQLRVNIEASVFPLKVNAPSKVKKGKMVGASWTGYNTSGPYKVELVTGTGQSYILGTESGTSINRQLDKNIDKGNYTLRVTPEKNPDDYGEAKIKVAGGSPVLWIAAPVVLGGGAAAYFLLGGEDPGGGTNEPGGLPDPPDLPN